MSRILALCRHGDHQSNRTTPIGFAQLERSAAWVARQIHAVARAGCGGREVAIVSSDEPRAIEGAARYTQVLRQMGIVVAVLGVDRRLGCDSEALGRLRRRLPDIPPYGKGFMNGWRGVDAAILREVGVGSPTDVGILAAEAVWEGFDESGPDSYLIVVGHGTTHEPTYETIYGQPMEDMPSAGVRMVLDEDGRSTDFDPASGGEYEFDAVGMPVTSLEICPTT